MKICVVTTVSKIMDWFVVDTMRYFYSKGDDITLACDMDDKFIEKNKDYAKCIQVPMKRGIDMFGFMKSMKILISLFRKERYDVIQYSAPAAALCASIAGKLCKVPVRIYCQWGIRYVGYTGWKRIILKCLEKVICSLSTEVEPDSKGNLEFGIGEKLYKAKKAHVIWNGSACGINMKKFCIDNKCEWNVQIREKYDIKNEEFVYGFVGRITRDKGITELINAYLNLRKTNKNAKLMLVGDQEELETLSADVRENMSEENGVIMTGKVEDAERYMAAMNVFILPSYREGFGSVVIEAAAMGVPIIVSDIPGPTDVINHMENGLIVKKKNCDDLQEAMRRLYESDELCKQLGNNAYITAKLKYEQQQMFQYIRADRLALIEGKEKRS